MPRYQARVEKALDRWLPDAHRPPARLHEAMRYATLQGGKRIRPLLVYATGEALGLQPARLDGPAAAVELIHAYSLVHDDLPAMDDDALRRGRPTCHRAYDEATAILAGDALQTLAFRVLAGDAAMEAAPETRLRMIATLTEAAGSRGMVGGQAMDLAAVGRALSEPELEAMHIHKTGALIRASVLLGALGATEAEERRLERLDHYGKCLGLAFQVQDDILDVEGDTEALGKQCGADARLNKPTYPALMGLEPARALARELVDDALESLAGLDSRADVLRGLARYVISRDS
ncbi:(2E,6E)-farnesyl diphosphate synthase [Alkalilimnicola sp. S0819]|nr:(2E,6E)-farnesyl diphosphate synthase [Alkalilimnicola sp. S0819]MPQ15457.1 (2E,6E)-farnesyl diphosphate synthase [Alkalilimnicola sp. S0819]